MISGDSDMISKTNASSSCNNNDAIEEILISNGGSRSSDISITTHYPLYLSRQNSQRFSRVQQIRDSKIARRLVRKNGSLNVWRMIPEKWFRYARDLGNTLINTRWGWTLLTLNLSYSLTWILFACIWYLIAESNGDIDEENPSKTPCLNGIHSFTGYLLFSVETQSTIGYGGRVINHNCPEAILLLIIQIIFGSGFCGLIVSIVYVKMSVPKVHTKTVFSRRAVISQRDGELCFMFRIRDDCNRHQLRTKVKAYVVQKRINEPFLKSIELEPIGILLWPLEVVHRITPTSPFWDLSARDLILKSFEIIVVMEGLSSINSHSSKSRTSYISSEMMWGSRFKPCISYCNKKNCYEIDDKAFNATEEVLTPLCSCKRLQEVLKELGESSSPSSLYSPLFYRSMKHPEWEGIEEEEELMSYLDNTSSISLRNNIQSPSLNSTIPINREDNFTVAEVHPTNNQKLESNGINKSKMNGSINQVDKNNKEGNIDDVNKMKNNSTGISNNQQNGDVGYLISSLEKFVSNDLVKTKPKVYQETDL